MYAYNGKEQILRLVCAGCGGHIMPESITFMPCFGDAPKGYKHLWYCPICKRYCCCSIQSGNPFTSAKCPECMSKLVNTDKMARMRWL